jgi:hypothetical protein
MSRRKRRKQTETPLAPSEVSARAEKKLRQADFFAGHLNISARRPSSSQSEEMEFYVSASATAARSAFYVMRDHGGRAFSRAQKAWRRAHPPDDMAFHQRMIDLRDEDVHQGTVDATTHTKYVDAQTFGGLQGFGYPFEAMVEETNPDGTKVRAQALPAVPGLYIERAGKRIEAATACRRFTSLLRKLVEELKRTASD